MHSRSRVFSTYHTRLECLHFLSSYLSHSRVVYLFCRCLQTDVCGSGGVEKKIIFYNRYVCGSVNVSLCMRVCAWACVFVCVGSLVPVGDVTNSHPPFVSDVATSPFYCFVYQAQHQFDPRGKNNSQVQKAEVRRCRQSASCGAKCKIYWVNIGRKHCALWGLSGRNDDQRYLRSILFLAKPSY